MSIEENQKKILIAVHETEENMATKLSSIPIPYRKKLD